VKIGRASFFLAWLTVLATTDRGQGQTITVGHVPITLRAAIEISLLHNRALQIERINPELAQSELSAAYGAYDPLLSAQGRREHVSDSGAFDPANPAVDKGFDTASDIAGFGLSGLLPSGLIYNFNGNYGYSSGSRDFLNFDAYRVAGGAYLQQPLLKNFWIDNNRLTILVAKNQLKYSEQGLRNQIITTVTAVENAYYELIYARENVVVQQEALTLAQTQLDQDKQRVQVGSLAPLDVKQDEAQVAQSRANLIAAQNTLSINQNTLKNLITDSYSQWHDVDTTSVCQGVEYRI